MAEVDRTIRIRASQETVFREWLRFDAFPHFADNAPPAEWDGERSLRWSSNGEQGRAQITELQASERVVWNVAEPGGSTLRSGIATFTPTAEQGTELSLHLEYESRGLGDNLRSLVGGVDARVEQALDRFRDAIETPAMPEEAGNRQDSFDAASDLTDRPAPPEGEWRGVGRKSSFGAD